MRLASLLSDAFLSEAEIALRDDERPRSQDEAEAVKAEATRALGPIAAWKLGGTIAAVRADLKLERAFFGALPARCVFDDGADVATFHTRLRGVESEYGFELARDVGPEDVEADFHELFACVRPAIEIPGTRYASLGLYGGLGLVADFGAAGGLALGPARPLPRDFAALDEAPVALTFGGREAALGGSRIIDGGATGPLRAFLRQATQARFSLKTGFSLKKGQTIVTGSCTGYLKAPLNETVEARFDALDASVRLVFKD